MTEQRDLKRLVRERMARTGESYTTARRHVTGPAHTRPADTGHHRLSLLVARLLRHAGHVAPHTGEPFTEAMVCGLAGGIGFLYAVFEYRGLPPMVTLVAQHHPDPWAPAALRRAGVAFTEAHSGSPAPALAALRRDLDAGRAVLCTVSRGDLPWHPDDPFAADPFPVLVTGDGDGVLVDDGTGAPHAVPVDVLATAWSAHRKGRHHRLTVAPERTGGLDVRDALATTVGHLTGPVLGNAFDVNFGLSGLERFAAQLADDRTRSGWRRRFAGTGGLDAALARVHDCLERELTSPGATRPLYAAFLDEAAGVHDGARLRRAADAYRRAGARWSRLAGAALSASTSTEGPETELSRLAELARDVLAAEREAVAVIDYR
jgi:hypothetical protein